MPTRYRRCSQDSWPAKSGSADGSRMACTQLKWVEEAKIDPELLTVKCDLNTARFAVFQIELGCKSDVTRATKCRAATLRHTRMSVTIATGKLRAWSGADPCSSGRERGGPAPRRPGVDVDLVACRAHGRTFCGGSPRTQAVKFGSSCWLAGQPLIHSSKESRSTKRTPRFLPGMVGAYDLMTPVRIRRPASDREIGRS